MEVKHFIDRDGDQMTDAFYKRDGVPTYSRLLGHLSIEQVQVDLAAKRLLAARVKYVQS